MNGCTSKMNESMILGGRLLEGEMEGRRANKNACLSAYLSRRFPQGYASLYFALEVRETDHSCKKKLRRNSVLMVL